MFWHNTSFFLCLLSASVRNTSDIAQQALKGYGKGGKMIKVVDNPLTP